MASLEPSVAEVRRAVGSAVCDLAPGSTLLVACSGGADSLALASAAAFVAARAGLFLDAAVVDHGLQPGSGVVARMVADTLGGLGCRTVHVLRVNVGADGGPEAAARSARYGALDQIDADVVLLGHTRDDQAETVLLGLARGSGPRSIAGMRPVSGRYRRPLLGVARATTELYCAVLGLRPWADPHNRDPTYARVRVRSLLLPALEQSLGPGVTAALARTGELLRRDNDALDLWAATAVAGAPDGVVCIGDLEGLPRAVRTRVIRSAALAAGVSATDLTFGHVDAVDGLVTDWHGQHGVDLPGGLRAVREADRIVFVPAASDGPPVVVTRLRPWTPST